MLTCRIHAKEDMRVEPEADPDIEPGQVLIRLGAGGICGSDIHYYFEGRNGSFVIREPLVPGHEASGVIAKIGTGVTRVKVGDKVAVSPSHACGQCDYCREGREQLCRNMRFLGSASVYPHVQGMFAEYFVLGERQCYPVSGAVSLGELAFAEPLAVALHAVNRAGELLGKSVLVTGGVPQHYLSNSFRRNVMQLLMRCFLLVAAAVLGFAAPSAFAQTKLKWAHVYETSEPYHKWSVWAAQEIEKRTNGKYHVDVFPASSLGKESDINQGLTLGTVDMIISGLSFAARTMPRIGVGYYPYTFRDGDHLIKWAKSDAFKQMTDEYRQKTGIQITSMTYYGVRQTSSNKPFTDCASMKGLKMRVPDVPAYLALPKSCGANPTPIAFAEVYLALQNGTVDAQENPLTTIEAKKFYEVQKYIILTGHIVDSLATQVAPHVWSKLSDQEKKVFFDVTQEAAAQATAEIQKREKELVDEFKKKGLTVTAVDKKSFREAILKNVTFESMGYSKADWEKIQAIQ